MDGRKLIMCSDITNFQTSRYDWYNKNALTQGPPLSKDEKDLK